MSLVERLIAVCVPETTQAVVSGTQTAIIGPDEMSEAELAEYHREHRDDELGEQVDFEIAKPLRITMSPLDDRGATALRE